MALKFLGYLNIYCITLLLHYCIKNLKLAYVKCHLWFRLGLKNCFLVSGATDGLRIILTDTENELLTIPLVVFYYLMVVE